MLLPTRFHAEKQIHELHKSDIYIEDSKTIEEWLQLCQLSQSDVEALHKIDDLMDEHASTIADRHYQMIMSIPEIKDIFNQHTIYERYTSLIMKYFKQLTKPKIDTAYIEYRKKIGRIHSRIRLTDDWYIGSFTRVYEYLVPYIIERYRSKPNELSTVLIALNRIITFDSLIVLSAYQEANDYYLVESISTVTDSVMKADKVKELLDNVNATVEETANVGAAAEDLSKSVQEVATNAINVSENAGLMINEAKEGQEIIKSSLNEFIRMAEEFNQTKEKIDHLIFDIQEITKVVELIEHIAEETNLLALNASIESARAGESGRGFSVVASEIRKLAEQTKQSVKQIGDSIQGIQAESKDVGKTADTMASSLTDRAEQVKDAILTMNQLVEQIQVIGDSMTSITSIAEEQTAATEDITNWMHDIQVYTEKVKTSTDETGKSIYLSSKEINSLRKLVIDVIPELTDEQLIRISQTEHRLYKWELYNGLLGYQIDDTLHELSNCRLSEWLEDGKGRSKKIEVNQLHHRFHTKMDEILTLIGANKITDANVAMRELEVVSEKLQGALEKLK